MEINSNNFLRWNSDPNVKDPYYIPSPYPIEHSILPYMPVLVPGEKTRFYINVKGGANVPGGSINLLNPDGSVAMAAIGSTQTDDLGDGNFNLYAELTGPVAPSGIYRLQIGSGLVSNLVRVVHNLYADKTTLIKYRNNGRNLFGFNWVGMDEFYQQFRLHIFRIDQQPEYNIEQYRSSTSGKLRNLNGSIDRYVKFQSYYFDKEAHEACEAMLFHSEIWINGKFYTFKSGYSSEPLTASKKSKGEFELWDEGFSSLNRC